MEKHSKYRVTQLDESGKREISFMDDSELQKFRAQRLKAVRRDELGLTQKSLADAIGVNLRTLQDWEIGRSPMPRPVEILLNLMKEMPAVKKRLLSS